MNEFEREVRAIPDIAPVLEHLGLMTMIWNHIETLWYLIYTCLLHEIPREKADRIFQQFQTGSAQRDFIATLADEAFPDGSPLRKRLGQLIAQTNDLSGDRNAFTHGDYVRAVRGLRIAPGSDKNKKPNKMAGKELTAELQTFMTTAEALADELNDFRIILIQEFLPNYKRIRPYSTEDLASLPKHTRDHLPKELRERVAPPNLRAED